MGGRALKGRLALWCESSQCSSTAKELLTPIKKTGGIMAADKKKIGHYVQLGGIAAFTLGAILSLHHVAIGTAFIGGAVAFYVG